MYSSIVISHIICIVLYFTALSQPPGPYSPSFGWRAAAGAQAPAAATARFEEKRFEMYYIEGQQMV